MTKRALFTGITGQDGSYLAEYLLSLRDFVKVDDRYYRPSEVDLLTGDASKAHQLLGWKPTYTFRKLIEEMVAADLASAAGAHPLKNHASSTTR